eukprot:m.241900 g.241900  ORF g.241900 m.241900 type:complete len:122 (-) comp26593_c0_seq1:190-555(-)
MTVVENWNRTQKPRDQLPMELVHKMLNAENYAGKDNSCASVNGIKAFIRDLMGEVAAVVESKGDLKTVDFGNTIGKDPKPVKTPVRKMNEFVQQEEPKNVDHYDENENVHACLQAVHSKSK